jgi:membrane protease subunit HflK
MNQRGGGYGEPINFPQIQIPRFSGGIVRTGVLVLLILIALLTSFYTVGPEQIGVVLRFGRYVRSTDPGLHFKLPYGIENVTKVPVQRQLKQEFGFRTRSAGVRSDYTKRGYEGEANMLTGDLNAADVEWVVQYRVVDPERFLFRVRNVQPTFRDMSEAVMREVVGDRTVNEVLTVGRQEVADQVEQRLQLLCEQYETGIKVEQVVLQDVNPPDPVKPSFNEVNEAQQEKETLINEAQAEYNRVIPRARGEAQKTIQQAEGYLLDRVNRARGDSARFAALYQSFRLAPEVTRTRIYLRGLLPLLNLGEQAVGKGGN